MTHVLVPVEVLEGETVSAGLIRLLGTVDVTILGYHVLPEQTPPDQARAQFEERATEALGELREEFEAAGSNTDHRLVFTHNREQSIKRVSNDVGADAFALTGLSGNVETMLVSLSGNVDIDHILSVVTAIIDGRDIGVTLFLVGGKDAAADARLADARTHLEDAGIAVETVRSTEGSPFDTLVTEVEGHDTVVMGEKAPSLRSLVFGDEAERVASASVGPVVVVRSIGDTDDGSDSVTADAE